MIFALWYFVLFLLLLFPPGQKGGVSTTAVLMFLVLLFWMFLGTAVLDDFVFGTVDVETGLSFTSMDLDRRW